jgi:hypothetical protein
MKLFKMLRMMFVITFLALIYIHMQMQIVAMAYEGKNKEKEIIRMKEKNGMLAYHILELKSSNHIGVKLLAEDSKFKFRDPENVVQIVTTKPVREAQGMQVAQSKKNSNSFLNFLSLKSEAEAQAQEESAPAKPWLKFR